MDKKVCAVVVTYNRIELLIRNIRSIKKQTYPVDILIYDNASTDGTYEMLKVNGFLDDKNLIYIKSEINKGGAGGFCSGEKIAFEMGYDYIWLMDDDGYCLNENTLELLMNEMSKTEKMILNSYIVCDEVKLVPTFNIGGYESYDQVVNNSDNRMLVGYGNPYNSTLVPKVCFEEIGFTDERFFIYGDEHDFYMRSNRAGFVWVTVIDSLYYHPVNRSILKTIRVKGKNIEVKNQPVWKFFLESRNGTYIDLKYNKKTKIFSYILKAMLIGLFSQDKKLKRIFYGILGVLDAKNENFDRKIMFRA